VLLFLVVSVPLAALRLPWLNVTLCKSGIRSSTSYLLRGSKASLSISLPVLCGVSPCYLYAAAALLAAALTLRERGTGFGFLCVAC